MLSRPAFSRWILALVLLTPAASAQKKVYTTNADFDGGSGSNVCHGPASKLDCWDNTPDQLVLGRTRVSKLARVWADNYYMGWIVGIDSNTGRQFARFDSAITHINGKATGGQPAATVNGGPHFCNWSNTGNCPGRVTTDTNGDVWIINRAFGQIGTLAKFSGTIDHCIDRNGNGVIDTSSDVNGDGIVNPQDPAEYFGQNDECILATIPLGGHNHVPRGVAVDKKGKIWASTYNGRQVFRFNPNEPVALEATINLPQTAASTPTSLSPLRPPSTSRRRRPPVATPTRWPPAATTSTSPARGPTAAHASTSTRSRSRRGLAVAPTALPPPPPGTRCTSADGEGQGS
jgi:hypothetical protein